MDPSQPLTRFVRPLTDGNAIRDEIRSVPELVEFNAANNPDHLFCIQTQRPAGGAQPTFLDITFARLKEAVQRCAAWLTANVIEVSLPYKDSTGEVLRGPPVALFVDSNIGLLIHEYALMCLGVPVLLLSARLSPTAINHLLSKTAAKAIIVSPRAKAIVAEALAINGREYSPPTLYLQIPYETLLASETTATSPNEDFFVPHHYTGENDRNVLILHSSGTTGLPKPIYTSHRYSLTFPTCHAFSSKEEAQKLALSTLPLYHGFGRLTPGLSMGVGMTFCLPISSTIPTGSSAVDLLVHTKAKSMFTVPSILEEISLLPENNGISVLQTLQFVAFGGGLLKPSVGARLEKLGVRLLNHYGATETGPLAPVFVPTRDYNWRYFRLREDIRKPLEIRLDPRSPSEDDVQRFTLSLRPPGWTERYEVQDLLISNPQNPTSDFNAVGRNDDMIVLATGEKVIPRILESTLSQSDLVKAAVAFGDGQFEIGFLVEPVEQLSLDMIEGFKHSIWPLVQEANRQMDAPGWISSRHAIIVVDPNAIPRADKGTLLRREAIKVFDHEIKEAYRNLEAPLDSLNPLEMHDLEHGLRQLIQNHVFWNVPDQELDNDHDFFELGMNSLQAVQLRRLLMASLPSDLEHPNTRSKIGRGFAYQYPSITKMTYALRNLDKVDGLVNGYESIDELVQNYAIKPPIRSESPKEHFVLLIGSTGSLGSYVLASLVMQPNVTKVVCINRRSKKDAYERQEEAFRHRGVTVSQDLWSKIRIFQTDAAADKLGLADDVYAGLRMQLTHIVHNAWPVDFKLLLPSFASQFRILQNTLHLAKGINSASQFVRPRVFFVSSIAVVGHYHDIHSEHVVPEILPVAKGCTMATGYAEAKLVCERIIGLAADEYSDGIEVACARFGQIAGAQNTGYWSPKEHIAALVKSSEKIGKLPLLQGTHSWLPLDCAADTLVELLLDPRPTALVYHIENPIRQSWRDTLDVLASGLGLSHSDYLPFDQWLRIVCANDIDENPGKSLAEFFEHDFVRMSSGNVILGTEKARIASSTLRKSTVVSKETIESYIDQWRAAGFLRQSH